MSLIFFTLKNYPSEASTLVARQLNIVGQIDAFTISVARNIHYVFKKLACLIVFLKDKGVLSSVPAQGFSSNFAHKYLIIYEL